MFYVVIFLCGACLGYGMFRLLLVVVPRRMEASEEARHREVIVESRKQADAIRANYARRGGDELAVSRSELEESVRGKREDLQVVEDNLNAQEDYLQQEEERVAQTETRVERSEGRVSAARERYVSEAEVFAKEHEQLREGLRERCGERADLQGRIVSQIVESHRVECQKLLKAIVFDHNSGAKRIAQRFLSRVHARYSPEFVWPRLLNSVEAKDKKRCEHLRENEVLLNELSELAEGVQFRFTDDYIVKLNGGFGVAREAMRLTLQDIMVRDRGRWEKAEQLYLSHLTRVDQEALRLGQRACRELQLVDIHTEVQKLIGCLNWRTSYKQNQWYHSVEVATLAGLLAHELGVEPDMARRCGLLHDIGKAIDYRIDGSHAVISGDYADRYGEERVICDTVMSHHDDLKVETPLAHVLKSADTLSGARPGARVNLEEDYQSRLSAIEDVVRSFRGVAKVMIMNGAREIHVDVDQANVKEADLEGLANRIAEKLSEEVTFPGQIKIMLSRKFEASKVA